MGICKTTEEKFVEIKQAIKDDDYDKFRPLYEKLSFDEKRSLSLLYTNDNFIKLRGRLEREERFKNWKLCGLATLIILILIGLLCWVYREVLTTDPMVYLEKLPFPQTIDDPPLTVTDIDYLIDYFLHDLYGEIVSYFYGRFSKSYETMKLSLKCAIVKYEYNWASNFTVEKMLLKQDYYFKVSELGNYEEAMCLNYDELVEITKYLDVIAGCYLATRDERYLDVLEKFTNSSHLHIRTAAQFAYKNFKPKFVFHEFKDCPEKPVKICKKIEETEIYPHFQ
jgi:hypothetical protein